LSKFPIAIAILLTDWFVLCSANKLVGELRDKYLIVKPVGRTYPVTKNALDSPTYFLDEADKRRIPGSSINSIQPDIFEEKPAQKVYSLGASSTSPY
jgi:hypothetical protein